MSTLGLILRVAISIGLIAMLAWQIGLQNLSSRLLALDPYWTGLAFVAVFAAIAVSVWKWRLILRTRGYVISSARLTRHYFVGLAFNNVLPTTVGGDAVRAWETTRDTGEYPEAIGSVVTERLIAGVSLGVTTLVGLLFVPANARLAGLAVLFLIIDMALVVLFLVPRVAEGIVSALTPPRMNEFRSQVHHTVTVIRATLMNQRLFASVAVLSVVFQVIVAMVNACVFQALGVPVSLAHCIIFTPMIFTITMLPISVSGLGVREVGYVYFFSHIAVGATDAVAASIAFFIIVSIASLPGAVLFALNPRGVRNNDGALTNPPLR